MSGVVKVGENYYVKVHERVTDFRNASGDNLGIETQCLSVDERGAFFKAEIKNAAGFVLAVGHRFIPHGGTDAVTTAETQAVGRALAFLGYSSQALLPELIEKISDAADSPVSLKSDGKSSEGTALAERLAHSKTVPFTAQLNTRGKQ